MVSRERHCQIRSPILIPMLASETFAVNFGKRNQTQYCHLIWRTKWNKLGSRAAEASYVVWTVFGEDDAAEHTTQIWLKQLDCSDEAPNNTTTTTTNNNNSSNKWLLRQVAISFRESESTCSSLLAFTYGMKRTRDAVDCLLTDSCRAVAFLF